MQNTYPIVDIGTNLIHRRFNGDRPQVMERARKAGVIAIIITGTSVRESQKAASFTKDHPGFTFSTAGVHPHNARMCDRKTISTLRSLALEHDYVVAIGECGLDFDRNFSPPQVQERWFIEQLELAREIQYPVFLHEREAHERFSDILSGFASDLPGGVVHCFTGTAPAARRYLDMGMYIGITGAILDRRWPHLREVVRSIPLDRLLIETDAPFLLPKGTDFQPRQSRRNESGFLPYVLSAIAEAREEPAEEIARATTENVRQLFGLEIHPDREVPA